MLTSLANLISGCITLVPERAAYWPSIPKPEAPCPQQERPGKSVGLSCSRPGVACWNFQRLVDLKQCDVVQFLSLLDLTPLLAQPQSSQLQLSAPVSATPATTGGTDLPPPVVQLQSQQSSAGVFHLLAAPVPTTLAVKGETFEETQMDTVHHCLTASPKRHWFYQDYQAEMAG
ncbi:uncharacterized protein isoform X2 [Salmo salar]|uniref:Uncharacterized protein isoform X2 n=1 Tax=Salmo salar TaxID=8030 RepID=A0A1S3NBS0_SALSA|nr:uncharacterized protein LOC106578363 isoform X2 [Salmo salar]|eukprot:XP_014012556.1 PREDICTED: uncharacterized protein LOC106578363 isoform X2 [Salmo salar]